MKGGRWTRRPRDGTLRVGRVTVLEGVGEGVSLVADQSGAGVFLRVASSFACQFWRVRLGRIAKLDRFTACFRRNETFWMEPRAGTSVTEVPGDTQWLLARRTDGRFVLVVPILDGPLRFCLDGREGALELWADSGNPWTTRTSGVGAFLSVGDDPYEMQERGAQAVSARLRMGRLRREKALPDFSDLFGWCTWDAFYRDVSAKKVRHGLESFRRGGIPPRWLILDDGWLSTRAAPQGGGRLTGFEANAKFPGGLAPLVATAKREYGVRRFLVWHAVMGYWAGLDPSRFRRYGVRETARQDQPAYGRDMASMFLWIGLACGAIPARKIGGFYDAFHAALAAQGVDGVKVDNQASIELSAAALGGRVHLSRAYRRALEASCRRYFGGRLINCMSCASEMFYMARDSTLMRTSTDFWPLRPETHGAHVYANSQAGLWFGQFIHPDWDIFQSGHEMGSFHAAARAVSGSPVYVSDPPGKHDFSVLRKLVCSDGTVLRCAGVGRPSPDCLFRDPTREDVLLKVFNFNAHGALLGVFHARHDGGRAGPISGRVSLADIPGLRAGPCAVLAHHSGELRVLGAGDSWGIRLGAGRWELFSFAPLRKGRALLGLADKYNSTGAIEGLRHEGDRSTFRVRDAGTLVLYATRRPAAVAMDGLPHEIHHDAASAKGTVRIPSSGRVTVQWK